MPNTSAQPSDLSKQILDTFDSHSMITYDFTVSSFDGEVESKLYEGRVTATTEADPIPAYPAKLIKLEARALTPKEGLSDYVLIKFDDQVQLLHRSEKTLLRTRTYRFGSRLFLAGAKNNLSLFNGLSLLRTAESDQIRLGKRDTDNRPDLQELVVSQPDQETQIRFWIETASRSIREIVYEQKDGSKLIYKIDNLSWSDEEIRKEEFMINVPDGYNSREWVAGNVPVPGTLVEGWELEILDGKTIRLDDLKGQVVLLDFWATWCVNCQFTFPEIAELRKYFAGRPLTVLGMNYMENGDPVAHMEERGYDWTLIDGTPMGEEFQLDQTGLPIMIILDKMGRVVDFVVGYNRWQEGAQYNLLKEVIERNL